MATSQIEAILVEENMQLIERVKQLEEAQSECYIAAIEKSVVMEKQLADLKEKIVTYIQQLVEISVYGEIPKHDFQECTETYFGDLIEEVTKIWEKTT